MTWTDADDPEFIEDMVSRVCNAVRSIGNGDAATGMGGLENLSLEIKNGSERIAEALGELAEAIRDAT